MPTEKRKPTIFTTDPLAAIKELDSKLDVCVASFEARLSGGSATTQPSLDKLASDFKQFKVCMKLAIDLIRSQVTQTISAVDDLENRSRRKFLLFRGIKETEGEVLNALLTDIIVNKLKVHDFTTDSIRFCYRLGKDTTGAGKRPILVKFQTLDVRSRIWNSKKELKGAGVSIAEYLTAPRRDIFNEARKLFGVHKCWSQDGCVYLLTSDGAKHRLVSLAQLKEIVQKFPPAKVTAPAPAPEKSTMSTRTRQRHLTKNK